MKTTTTRGVLWEVIAPVVRWPMYSPARLGMVVAAVIVALVVVGQLTSDQSSPAAGSPTPSPTGLASPAASPSESSSAQQPPAGTEEAASAPTETAAADTEHTVTRLARRFVDAYLRRDGARKVWLSRLQGMTTRELGKSLASVDRANVKVLGRRATDVEARGVGATAAAAVVETDRGEVTVDLAYSGRAWQVARVTPSGPAAGER